ncbi:MAG: SusC/RagA family TonB-linked outer membrane protein, partial [Sphingobacteriaceae bacterium]
MHFKKVQKLIYFAFFCLFTLPVLAQTKVVTGKVTDAKDNSPLIGVSVVAAGSSTGTATDVTGNFRITVPQSATAIIFTYIGYTRKQIAITGSTLNVTMDAAGNSLNEVLVVGYGTVRKKDATGAVVKVSSGDFVQGVTTNPLQQLQGKAPGVVVTTFDGDPNSNPTVRIRGTASLSGGNDPLYVIDGIEGADIRSVSPNDIESFDVLKDASAAAIYGSRAAGGVILITTKTGKAGRTQVTANSYVAVESALKLPEFADRNLYLQLYQQTHVDAAGNHLSMPTGTTTTSDQGANTNWFKLITRTAVTHNENVAISGGTEKGHYRGSLTYYDQEGIAYNYRKDLNGRFNLDQKALNDKLLITMNVSGSHTQSKFVETPGQNGGDNNVFLNALSVPSVISPYNAPTNTVDPLNPNNYQSISNTQEANPLPLLFYTQNRNTISRLTGNLRLDYNLTKNITISPFANATRDNGFGYIYYPPGPLVKPIADVFGYTPQLTNTGDVDRNTTMSTTTTYGAYGNYKGTFGTSRLNVTVGGEQYQTNYQGLRVGAHDFSNINLTNINIGAANFITNKDISSYDNGYILNSLFGRVEYNLNDKYYITGNARYDHSNKLGINNQGQVFPSASVAWNISSEDFLKDVKWLTLLKLRGGYGQVGNQDAIGPYLSQFLFGSTGTLYYDGTTGQFLTRNFAVQNVNSFLRWEVNATANIAADFSLFDGRLNGSIDFFKKNTSHLLYNYTVPTGGQFFVNNIVANIGSLQNKGVEFNLNGKIFTQKDFNWTAALNFGLVRNKLTNLSGNLNGTDFNVTQAYTGGGTGGLGISGQVSQIGYLKVGYPVGTLLLPEYAGQDATGKQLFYKYAANGTRTTTTDLNSLNYADDGSTQDRKFYTTDPKFTYSITNSFTFKQFDLSIFLRGQYGGHAFNETYMDYSDLD